MHLKSVDDCAELDARQFWGQRRSLGGSSKAATIGPAEVIASKYRLDQHGIRIDGSRVSWQRMITRLVLHGPVTPLLPQSILQTLHTEVWVSESGLKTSLRNGPSDIDHE